MSVNVFTCFSFRESSKRLILRDREGASSSADQSARNHTRSDREDFGDESKHCFTPATCNIISVKHSTCTRHDKINKFTTEKKKSERFTYQASISLFSLFTNAHDN